MRQEPSEKPRYAIVAAVQLPQVSDTEFESSLAELRDLAKTLGYTISATFTQKRASFDAGAYLGSACLWQWDPLNARAELGYVLDPSRWGQGLVPEAVAAVLRFGCEHMGLHAVEAWTHPDNHASLRVLEKLEFRKEAHFKERNLNLVTHAWDDAVVYTHLFPAPRHRG